MPRTKARKKSGEALQGTVVEYLGSKTGKGKKGMWTRHDFTADFGSGAKRCSIFGDFDTALVGADIAVEADYNSQYDNYSVNSISPVELGEESASQKPAPAEPAKSTVVLKERTVATDLDSVRSEAEAVFKQDAEFVDRTLGGNTDPQALAVGIQAFQAIRATLFIEANKRGRVADMKSSRR